MPTRVICTAALQQFDSSANEVTITLVMQGDLYRGFATIW